MKSMTAYGQAEGKVGRGRLHIELKTINHRYFELALRLPPRMNSLEGRVRESLKKKIQRGKCDLYIREWEPVLGEAELKIDLDLARKYQKAILSLQKSLKVPMNGDVLSFIGLERLVHVSEPEGDYNRLWKQVERILNQAWQQIERMRKKEGAFLLKDQKKRLAALESAIRNIERLSKKNWQQVQDDMAPMLANSSSSVSLPTKMDVSEETTRLKSHVVQYRQLLAGRESVGRKADFLIQEMHREINTIGAKAQDAEISRYVIECKSELEKLREQIQNVE